MKKLLVQNNKRCLIFKEQEKFHFILKSIFQNSNLFMLTRWNAYLRFKKSNRKISISFRCVETINRKRFNRTIPFSRYFFLKLIRSGQLSGFKKSSW